MRTDARAHKHISYASSNTYPHISSYYFANVLCLSVNTRQVRLQTRVHNGVYTGSAYQFPRSVKEGLTLWRGVGPAVTRGMIGGAVYLGTNEYFKRLLGAKDSEPFGSGVWSASRGQ